MVLFFHNNNGIFYGRNYMNSWYKPKDELEECRRGVEASRHVLQSYRDLFRPIFRHQHSTLIKYPLLQQTDKMDFNYFNKHLSAREKKFEHFPQYNFNRIGKNYDSYYSTKLLLPNYKVIMNPFSSRMEIPSRIGESEHFFNAVDRASNIRTIAPELKLKGTRDSQYYCYGVKKRKPIHKKKKDEYDKLIYPHIKGVGGLFLPSKIILNNFKAWKWKNKKEIQANNLSMSMVYDLLLPKSTARKPFKKTDVFCQTTGKRKIHIEEEPGEYEWAQPPERKSSCFVPTDILLHHHKKTLPNVCIDGEETTNECGNNGDIARPNKFRKDKKTMCRDKEIKNDKVFTCVSRCGCRRKYKDQKTTFDCFTPCTTNSELPLIFKFEDYRCECYSCASNTLEPNRETKVIGNKAKRKKHKIKGKEKNIFLKNKVAEIDLKIDNGCNNSQGDKNGLMDTNDKLNIAKYIIISNDGVLEPDYGGSFNYDSGNTSSFDTNYLNTEECSTDNSRIKRRTFRCKSRWDSKRKRAFIPLHTYQSCLFRKSRPNFFSSSNTSYLKHRNRKMNRHKNRHLEKQLKNVIHKGLNLGVPNREVALKEKSKPTNRLNTDHEKDKLHKKREFVGESKLGRVSNPCYDYEDISTSMNLSSSEENTFAMTDSLKPTVVKTYTQVSTFIKTDTEIPIYSTFEKPPSILSKATGLISSGESTHSDFQIVKRSTEMIVIEIPTEVGHIFRPDTGNRHPAKLKCEHMHKTECICSVTNVLQEINNLISNNQDQKFLLNQLTKYNCSHYSPVDVSYKMSPELKPRLISNKHKELLADEKNGPKEIIDETFQELLIRDVPNEETDFYIFPSTNVEIPCFINNYVQLSPNTADSASYTWRQGDNKIITGGRVTEDLNHRGMLQIAEATIADSNNYTCTVNYTHPDTGQTVSDSFVHSVMVVTLPKFALHTLLHYKARVKCDQETLETFELYLPQQVEGYICYIEPGRKKICTIEIHNPICHPHSNELQDIDLKSVWKFQSKGLKQNPVASQENEENDMELSLNFELDIADVTQTMISAGNKTRCGPFCELKIILKVVDILRESFTIVLPHPVSSSGGVIFKPDVKSMNMKILIACEGGFKLVQGFCMPCPPGTYSEEGSTECSTCPSGTYQPNIGSKTCEKCPHPFRSGCWSLWLSPAVIGITFLIILLIVLVSTVLFFLSKYVIAKCMWPCLSPCIVRLFRKKKRKKYEEIFPRKLLKKKKRKQFLHEKDGTTEPPTPPTEDFTS
nr:uncharacterized protein LOC106688641 isoform X3 [Halyomorpha halys]